MANAKPPHVMIVEARFYEDIADELRRDAVGVLDAAGATHEGIAVPGAFEIPAAIAMAHDANPSRFDGYIALGCVIRGETTHYDYVCGQSARGLQDLAVRRGLAIGYGILTVENQAQAWARAAADKKAKGADAAQACLQMIELRRRLVQASE
jgi:6,7-dimethyl-8-ribityllumazine synthase